MNNLTEQGKKSGWYWVELKEGTFVDGKKSIVLDYFSELTNSFERHPYLVEQVLAKVPSYERLQQLKELLKLAKSSVSYHCALCREYTDGQILLSKINQVLGED